MLPASPIGRLHRLSFDFVIDSRVRTVVYAFAEKS